ncbi:50S ribosomal protein L25 [Paratissierella segnis]|jgi:large subunit ribosomal protein L25|uniref:Large ribosomal subunit protein bL25 n=1 Tax=Paratissierella segnis TaxID=2763679 RepID=A0A926ETB5_9FIRM|nr:50S ribosomal protein L25 [Paratissierella segnis]MBC8587271.1 50S ribosomal protein L25 [Paratissierella segnis]
MSIKMKVDLRTGIGSNKIKQLRKENYIPGVIYSRGKETKHVMVDNMAFEKTYRIAGTTSIIDLDLEGETVPVIIKEVQKHILKDKVLHVDFQELKMDEKLKMNIPIVLLNRDNIKLQPSVLMQLLDQVEIECLPKDIPQAAEIDVENMEFNAPKFVKDLDIAGNENITILNDLEMVVCSLSAPSLRDEEAETEEEVENDVEVADTASEDDEE